MRGRPSIAQRLGRAPLPPRLASSHPAPRTYTITHAQHAPGAVSQRRVSRIPVPVAPVTPVLPALAKSDFAPTDTSSGASLAKRYDSIDPAVYAPVFRRGGEKKAEVGVTRVSVATELNPSNAALSSQFSRVFAQPKNLEGVANKVRPSGTIKSKGRGVIAL
ncbi:hypothetical protein BC830DRAFT_1148323 [Chytriomyces sp. MP71]|nr:hypothetical protein BC830DRAFT_1148323 [Chytriomyces sp. MP71]